MAARIRIAGIIKESIVDGPGIRFVVFAQGCRHNCPGCHNPATHPLSGGSFVEVEDIINQMKNNPLLDGITLSGGEPFEQAEAFSELAEMAKNSGYNVMTYSGYTYENILINKSMNPGWSKLLNLTDTLVDGEFRLEEKSLLLQFRGSLNQRIIDVRQSIALNETVQHAF